MNGEDLYDVLNALPAKHRRALIAAYKHRFKGARTNRDRLQQIVAILGVDGVAPYRSLYLEGNGRLFIWYVARPLPLTTQEMLRRYTDRYDHPLEGERPNVELDEDPNFHRVEQCGDQLRIEYAYYGATIEIPNGWDTVQIKRFRRCAIIVRGNPVTFEFRRVPIGMRAALLRSLTADLGIQEDLLVPCLVKTEEQREQLRNALQATPKGIKKIGRGLGLGTIQIWTDGTVSLLEQIDYQGAQAAHHETYQLAWDFLTQHPTDGYLERATYAITVESGDMRVSEGSSELAIENLRHNVTALF